jgi:hypothetical protein
MLSDHELSTGATGSRHGSQSFSNLLLSELHVPGIVLLDSPLDLVTRGDSEGRCILGSVEYLGEARQ